MSKILFLFLSILIIFFSINAQLCFAKKNIILARRYKSSFAGADKTLRGWQDNFEPKTKIQEDYYRDREESGIIPLKKNEHDKYLERQGFSIKTDNYKKRYHGEEIEKENPEEEIYNGEPVSTEPYNINPDDYSNVHVNELSEEEKAAKLEELKENLKGLSEEEKEDLIGQSGIKELYEENTQTSQEEEYYDVNKYMQQK